MSMQMTITMDDNGQINVTGPIDNAIVAYGLLECAKQAITAHQASKNRSPVPPLSIARSLPSKSPRNGKN